MSLCTTMDSLGGHALDSDSYYTTCLPMHRHDHQQFFQQDLYMSSNDKHDALVPSPKSHIRTGSLYDDLEEFSRRGRSTSHEFDRFYPSVSSFFFVKMRHLIRNHAGYISQWKLLCGQLFLSVPPYFQHASRFFMCI